MTTFKRRLLAAFSAGSMFLSLASPVFAETTLEISGNGADSDSDIKLETTGDTTVVQSNYAEVKNIISSSSNTGYNDADKNTGGDVTIETGDASTSVDVSTSANANWAKVGGDGDQGTLSARILGNGADSDNDIKLKLDDDTTVVQDNYAYIKNKVYADADTGYNSADKNTGGDVLIETGDAEVGVEVDNMVNFNWADVDCGCTLDLLAKIAGNGFNSDNDIKVKLDNDQDIFQGGKENGNNAYLKNYLYGDADSGHNDADKNTGDPEGDPSIMTGDAASFVDVSNSGNVNVYGDISPEWPDLDLEFSFSLSLSDLLSLLALI